MKSGAPGTREGVIMELFRPTPKSFRSLQVKSPSLGYQSTFPNTEVLLSAIYLPHTPAQGKGLCTKGLGVRNGEFHTTT